MSADTFEDIDQAIEDARMAAMRWRHRCESLADLPEENPRPYLAHALATSWDRVAYELSLARRRVGRFNQADRLTVPADVHGSSSKTAQASREMAEAEMRRGLTANMLAPLEASLGLEPGTLARYRSHNPEESDGPRTPDAG